MKFDPQELQQVKDELRQNPTNHGVGVLHESTGEIHLAPFDDVPGGHADLVAREGLRAADCKGFLIAA